MRKIRDDTSSLVAKTEGPGHEMTAGHLRPIPIPDTSLRMDIPSSVDKLLDFHVANPAHVLSLFLLFLRGRFTTEPKQTNIIKIALQPRKKKKSLSLKMPDQRHKNRVSDDKLSASLKIFI